MKKITFLHLDHCPYCKHAKLAMNELIEANVKYKMIEVEMIEESREPDKAKPFAGKYYYVPTMFVGDEKIYEAKPGETYEECVEHVQRVFEAALN